jgi:hypothetical protein
MMAAAFGWGKFEFAPTTRELVNIEALLEASMGVKKEIGIVTGSTPPFVCPFDR